jgi:chaperonin GroES
VSVRPLRDRIVVQPDPLLEHVSSSGLILQARTGIGTSQEQLGRTGTVLAVGPGKTTRKGVTLPLVVQPGDKVLLGEWLYPQADGLLVAQEADVCGVLEA